MGTQECKLTNELRENSFQKSSTLTYIIWKKKAVCLSICTIRHSLLCKVHVGSKFRFIANQISEFGNVLRNAHQIFWTFRYFSINARLIMRTFFLKDSFFVYYYGLSLTSHSSIKYIKYLLGTYFVKGSVLRIIGIERWSFLQSL